MLTVPERGSADARDCLHVTDALSDEALIEARSRLDPAAGRMVSALWVSSTRQLVLTIHHLAVDGVSWRILLEDLNIAWAQHRGGQPVALRRPDVVYPMGFAAEPVRAPADVVATAEVWRQVAATPAALPAVRPETDTFAAAGYLSASLDAHDTRMLLGEVPAPSTPGSRHPADRLRPGSGSARAARGAPIGIDVEGHGRDEDIAPTSTCRARWVVHHQVPGVVDGRPLPWAQVVTGGPALGAVIKRAKEQLRALPDPLTYGVLRYLNDDVDIAESDPPIGFNYLGGWVPRGVCIR
ncbi:condensation domain protein [Mycobacterium xenopi 4042]|uniref:Condensation domain protein n=1 Tax=Mycobacterium xenopi 4042 TaxID=1299334 RepID=X8E8C2_MYCXE|nr:condensation domain protein [Mycobacterium xenopi 4042]